MIRASRAEVMDEDPNEPDQDNFETDNIPLSDFDRILKFRWDADNPDPDRRSCTE